MEILEVIVFKRSSLGTTLPFSFRKQPLIEPTLDDESLKNDIGDYDVDEDGNPRPLDEIYSR